MKKIILSVLVAMVLAACTKEETSISKIEEVKNPYAVTPDEAVQLLKTVIGGETTRAVSIGDIKTLRKSDFVPTTRGGEDGDLIYIVDLENGGSAVMGADKRMEPIYAILDETKISPEKLTQVATRGDDSEQDIEDYVMGLMNNKIQVDINGFEHNFPEMPMIPRPQEITFTTMLGSKYPMLATKWHQSFPFNSRFPYGEDDGKYFENGVMLAGCGPIAVAQVLYFHRMPTVLHNYIPNYNLLSQCEYQGTFSDAACAEVAEYVYRIAGQICDDLYHVEEPKPSVNAIDLPNNLRAFGLDAEALAIYDISGVKTLLETNLPVIVRGTHYDPNGIVLNDAGHMWVIDGYKSYRESTYLREFYGAGPKDFTDSLINSIDYNLVHCNYGWAGESDGYYTSGIFDLATNLSDDNIVDTIGDIKSPQLYDFSNMIKYVVYEK